MAYCSWEIALANQLLGAKPSSGTGPPGPLLYVPISSVYIHLFSLSVHLTKNASVTRICVKICLPVIEINSSRNQDTLQFPTE